MAGCTPWRVRVAPHRGITAREHIIPCWGASIAPFLLPSGSLTCGGHGQQELFAILGDSARPRVTVLVLDSLEAELDTRLAAIGDAHLVHLDKLTLRVCTRAAASRAGLLASPTIIVGGEFKASFCGCRLGF